MEHNHRLDELFELHLSRKASTAEKEELMRLLADEANEEQVGRLFAEVWKRFNPSRPVFNSRQSATMLDTALQRETAREGKTVQLYRWRKALAIAAAVASIVFGVWFFSHKENNDKEGTASYIKNDVAPGKNGATITLASGKVIELSDKKTGVVVGKDLKYSDGSEIDDSSLSQATSLPEREMSVLLTASTARGQTYQFTLPDGTRVWLNADSKISFPSKFSGAERKILLEGEGYFEVVHNAKQPFRVESTGSDGKKQVVEDIGTAFNISAYGNDQVTTTTLVEGEARVNAFDAITGRQSAVLKPNQQAIQNARGGMQVRKVDPEEAVSWKEGVFIYNSTPLDDVMRQVARWYNVEVVYKDTGLKTKLFGGSASRSDNVSKILRTIENTGAVHFKIEGRRITVVK